MTFGQLSNPSRVPALVAFLLVLSACISGPSTLPIESSADGTSVSATVGEAGGSVELPGKVALWIPKGAIKNDVKLTVSVVEPAIQLPGHQHSVAISVKPYDLALEAPMRLTFPLADTKPGESYTASRTRDDSAAAWEPMGGTEFNATTDTATVDTDTTGVFTVTESTTCVALPATSTCACPAGQVCTSAGTCKTTASFRLCDNTALTVLTGTIPNPDYVPPGAITDAVIAGQLGTAIGTACGLVPTTVNQATTGVLDVCDNAPLIDKGRTILLIGAGYSQRLADYADLSFSPIRQLIENGDTQSVFVTRAGTRALVFPRSELNDHHDYFSIALYREPKRGANILHIAGAGWEGGPAAAYYVTSTVLPQLKAGTRTWGSYLVVEWTDTNNDFLKNAGDTFTIRVTDVL
jgi:hypothetical protein